jgi:hypothetical protein
LGKGYRDKPDIRLTHRVYYSEWTSCLVLKFYSSFMILTLCGWAQISAVYLHWCLQRLFAEKAHASDFGAPAGGHVAMRCSRCACENICSAKIKRVRWRFPARERKHSKSRLMLALGAAGVSHQRKRFPVFVTHSLSAAVQQYSASANWIKLSSANARRLYRVALALQPRCLPKANQISMDHTRVHAAVVARCVPPFRYI